MEKRIRLEKALYVFCLLSFSASLAKADVLITEIMYNPPQGSEYEYIEIHNSGTASVDLSGWSFAKAVNYKFPPGTSIPAGAFLVVCGSREAFHAAYPSLPGEVVMVPFGGALSNDGGRLTLGDATGAVRQDLRYDDDSPWDFLADGFGASLERVCFTASPDLPENWRASKLPASLDAFGGSPGAPNGSQACPPVAPGKPRVLISEIMYHPVLEEALEDYHEFVEVFNAGKEAVSLGGWRLAGGIDYTFPAGAAIAPGEYKVVAKDRSKLAAVAAYSLREEDLFGNYERTLDNGGDKVALIGADGQGIDSVSYGDTAPWPAGPDALGAADSWLSEDLLPLEKHRYLGYSLERVSFDFPSGEIANWAPSPLDGATP